VFAKRSVAVVHNVVAAPSSEKPVINKPAVKCRFCKRQHGLKNCYKFKDLPYWERKDFSRAEKLCFECYGEGHVHVVLGSHMRPCKPSALDLTIANTWVRL